MSGFVALSVHVGMLAAGAPFPISHPPLWAQWLSEACVAGAVLGLLKLSHSGIGDRSVLARTVIVFLIIAAIQETLRIGIMSGVVSGAWAYSAIGLIKPLVRVFVVALSCVLAVRWVRGRHSLLIVALAVGAISTVSRKLVAHAVEPIIRQLAWLSKPDLYDFPYPAHVTVAAYLTFIEVVAGSLLMTIVVWDSLPQSKIVRMLIIAVLVALIKGVAGNILFYSAYTDSSVLLGIWAWSQFLIEFLILGCLVGMCWDAFGRSLQRRPI